MYVCLKCELSVSEWRQLFLFENISHHHCVLSVYTIYTDQKVNICIFKWHAIKRCCKMNEFLLYPIFTCMYVCMLISSRKTIFTWHESVCQSPILLKTIKKNNYSKKERLTVHLIVLALMFNSYTHSCL